MTFTISYVAPIPAAPTYTVNVKQIPRVVSLDANPTGAIYVHWQAVFDRAVANVMAANSFVNNSNNISPTPTITSVVPPSTVTVGIPYTHTFTAVGNGPMTFSKTAGTLPPGVTLSADGVLSGTPTAVGTGAYTGITVRVFGGAPSNSAQTFSLSIITTADETHFFEPDGELEPVMNQG